MTPNLRMNLSKPIISTITCSTTAFTNDKWFPKSGIVYAQTLKQLQPCHGFYITHIVGIGETRQGRDWVLDLLSESRKPGK